MISTSDHARDADDWDRLERLFEEGLEVPTPAREAWLLAQCPDDRALRESGMVTYPTVYVRVDQVTLRHLGGSRMQLTAIFRRGVPAGPILWYQIALFRGTENADTVQIFAPLNGQGWFATQGSYAVGALLFDESVPKGYDPGRNLATAVRIDGSRLDIVLDLEGVDGLFGHGPFRPTVRVKAQSGTTLFDAQQCDWDTRVS